MGSSRAAIADGMYAARRHSTERDDGHKGEILPMKKNRHLGHEIDR